MGNVGRRVKKIKKVRELMKLTDVSSEQLSFE